MIYYLEPVVKISAHLKNISCGNFSEFALLHFGLYLIILTLHMHLNLATNIVVVVGTSWTNMRIQIESLITIQLITLGSSIVAPPPLIISCSYYFM